MSSVYSDFMYVIWSKTGREDQTAQQLDRVLGDRAEYFSPQVEYFFRKKGEVLKIFKYAFPGYFFVKTEIENDEFITLVKKCARYSTSILKPLCYIGTYQAALNDIEREVIDVLWPGKDYIEASEGFLIGDKIIITEGPLVGRESTILAIAPRKRQVVVGIEIMGETRKLTIGLNLIKKIHHV